MSKSIFSSEQKCPLPKRICLVRWSVVASHNNQALHTEQASREALEESTMQTELVIPHFTPAFIGAAKVSSPSSAARTFPASVGGKARASCETDFFPCERATEDNQERRTCGPLPRSRSSSRDT